ncbi:MAG: anthranilate phosphoribosyltransferase [Alphaproteobacteria bacterium]|jgi:anthranilate phosphoribosyltransferase|nr:anthranilate phosphoribosyltransferase [Alphaproteobacteria bacterium]
MTGDITDFKQLLGLVAAGQRLSIEQAKFAFDIMMAGDATPSQMGAFLMGLRVRGETIEEITGGVLALRARAIRINAPAGAIDVVGTGGDGVGTWNISTCAAIVVASLGVPVAKHGNRAASSKSGAADVLTALGVNIDADMTLVQKALDEIGLCFLMAQRHHGSMRHVGPTRVELGTRTIFNLVGPLANPAGTRRLMMGVFARDWVEPIAYAQHNLGAERAWVVHGLDGLDELTTTTGSLVAELRDGEVRSFEVTPEDAGLERADIEALKGGDPATNALALNAVLDGHQGAYRDIVLMNAAAALIVAGRAETLRDGAAQAARAIDDGLARRTLDGLIRVSHETVSAK